MQRTGSQEPNALTMKVATYLALQPSFLVVCCTWSPWLLWPSGGDSDIMFHFMAAMRTSTQVLYTLITINGIGRALRNWGWGTITYQDTFVWRKTKLLFCDILTLSNTTSARAIVTVLCSTRDLIITTCCS